MNRITSFIFLFMYVTSYAAAQHNKQIKLAWKIAGSLPAPASSERSLGVAGPVSGIHNNILVVAGGANFPGDMPWLGGMKEYYDELFAYEISEDSLKIIPSTFNLNNKIAYAASCSTSMGIVYAGGENHEGLSVKAWLLQYNAKDNNFVEIALPDLPLALANASISESNNKLYLAGGETLTGASTGLYSLDLNNIDRGWISLADVPKPISHAVMAISESGDRTEIYLLGGRKKNAAGISDLYSSVYVYNVHENEWKEKPSLPYPLSAGTGVCFGASILLFGGDRGVVFNQTEVLIRAINAESDPVRKQRLNEQKIKLQSAHPGFSSEVLMYDTCSGSTRSIGQLPYETPVTTLAIKSGNNVFIPSGEIRAGVRTPSILLGKIILEE